MFRITLPSEFACTARSWKDNSATQAEVITRAIETINLYNNSDITELPEGTQIVSF